MNKQYQEAYSFCKAYYDKHDYPVYHNWWHSVEVLAALEKICDWYAVPEADRITLKIAALGHDLGHLKGPKNHEQNSIDILQPFLDEQCFDKASQESIAQYIRATDITTTPETFEEKLMRDADLFYLGTADYWEQAELYRQELTDAGQNFTDKEWNTFQLNFLRQQTFFLNRVEEKLQGTRNNHILKLTKLIEI